METYKTIKNAGIDVSEKTIDDVIENSKDYIKDYFYQRDEYGDFIEED